MIRSTLLATLALTFTIPAFAAGSWVDDDSWQPTPSTSPTRASGSSRKSASNYQRPKDLRPFSPGSNNVSLEIGQTFLLGDHSAYDDSLSYTGNYTYGVSRLMAFESALGYSNHSEGKYSMLSLSAGGRMNLSYYDRIIPYAHAGLGFYKPSREVNENASLSATLFGLYVGAGADLSLSPEMFFGAAFTFHNAFGTTKQTSVGPVSLGGSYANFLARVGYTF